MNWLVDLNVELTLEQIDVLAQLDKGQLLQDKTHPGCCVTRKKWLAQGFIQVSITRLARYYFTWQRDCKTPQAQDWLIKGKSVICFGCPAHCGFSWGGGLFDFQPSLFSQFEGENDITL